MGVRVQRHHPRDELVDGEREGGIVEDVPAGLVRLIEQHNALDIELYRLARARFDAEAAAAGDMTGEVEERWPPIEH